MRIAILEDQPEQAALIKSVLASEGHDCDVFLAGGALIAAAGQTRFDLFVLDWEVPDISGEEVLRWVRKNVPAPVPVMFVTGRNAEKDIISALKNGADDYVTKPYLRGVLAARVEALLRRAYPQRTPALLTVKQFAFDPKISHLSLAGTPVHLTQREFDLALLLFQNLDMLLSREQIQESVWGRRAIGASSRTIDTHVSRLRLKLDLQPETGFVLTTVYKYGYRLEQVTPAA